MEDLKEKLSFVLVIIVAVVILGLAYYFFCVKEVVYYTQIDNTKIEKVSATDEMIYQYTLDCYNENGKKKEIQFKTSRELREDAYLMLEVINATGVHSWEEVQFNELPSKVQEQYTK